MWLLSKNIESLQEDLGFELNLHHDLAGNVAVLDVARSWF